MQYCKVNRAYYYRGGGSSFGLFNDQSNPTNPAHKNFCNYAAQCFNLFTRMFETPYLLTQDNDFSTGLTTLVGENEAGNKINILAANYEIDLVFGNPLMSPEGPLNQQYYLDTNRTVNQLNDDWSKEHWFGGIDPNTVIYNNLVHQRPYVSRTPLTVFPPRREQNNTLSRTGLNITIRNIANSFRNYKITAYRIKEGGRLDRMIPEEETTSISSSFSNGVLNITDRGALPSTVTLYTIDFTG
ncbi:hypothetical protein [Commensalibacter communis]|uniref:hypothetical protein n=1 Tax=Commensalibacter communis TaxID=2972786 RepID=UPI00232F2F2B|nr:hypothetical protein [Commensalibacter communis]